MPEKAHVTSVEAIDDFRSSVIVYVSKARPALEEVTSEVLRMRLWLENDQRAVLEGLVRRRRKELEQAQAALASARMAVIKHETTAEQMAVGRAKRNLEEAEHKLKRLKYWDREFATVVEPLAKQLEKLHTVLSSDLGKAAAQLQRVVTRLSDYAGIAPANSAGAPVSGGVEPGDSGAATASPAAGTGEGTPGGGPGPEVL